MSNIETRPEWDEYFGNIAWAVSLRGDCRRRQVGAVLVKERRIVATGYNGTPANHASCLVEGACPRSYSDVEPGSSYDTGAGTCISIHAESNALLYADRDKCEGATLYVTATPCDGCYRLIQGAGVARIVVKDPGLLSELRQSVKG